jgi:hypothetical protein
MRLARSPSADVTRLTQPGSLPGVPEHVGPIVAFLFVSLS